MNDQDLCPPIRLGRWRRRAKSVLDLQRQRVRHVEERRGDRDRGHGEQEQKERGCSIHKSDPYRSSPRLPGSVNRTTCAGIGLIMHVGFLPA